MTTSPQILKEELEASNAVYTGVIPSDLTAIVVGGVPEDDSNGFNAKAFKDSVGNVIIAFEGTQPNPATAYPNAIFGVNSLAADALLGSGGIPKALVEAQSFAQQVLNAVGSSATVYVTGHSLGGAEAEAASAEFGFSGDLFGAPGISIPAAQQGPNKLFLTDLSAAEANLTDYIDWGDPVGNLGTDTTAGAYYSLPGITHIAQIQMVGLPSDGAALVANGKLFEQKGKELAFDVLIGR